MTPIKSQDNINVGIKLMKKYYLKNKSTFTIAPDKTFFLSTKNTNISLISLRKHILWTWSEEACDFGIIITFCARCLEFCGLLWDAYFALQALCAQLIIAQWTHNVVTVSHQRRCNVDNVASTSIQRHVPAGRDLERLI